MIRHHFALYLASRGLAAFGNLAAIAIFTRLAGPEIYGHYVVMFAVGLVISGFSAQWVRYGFFNNYRSDEDSAFFASFVAVLAASMAITIVVASIAFALEGASAVFAAGALLIGLSSALFEVLTEVCRTRLDAGRASLSVVLKAVLVLAFGTFALLTERSALALALGLAVAHLVASIPAAITLGKLLGGRPTWRETRRLLIFGWPLMLSFGIGAFAQGIDRFFLAGVEGAVVIGGYGAVSDLVRSSFSILGESISLSTVPLAKRQHAEGDFEGATRTLNHAWSMLLVLGAFAVSGLIVFGPVLLPIVFPASFLDDAHEILPVIVVAAFLLVARNTYLAQIIYFTKSSWLELASALILTIVNIVLCLLLVQPLGAFGAALAFLGGQVAAGLLFLLAGRGGFRMPTPWRPTLGLTLVCLLLVGIGRAIGAAGLPLLASLALQAGLFLVVFVATTYAMGIRIEPIKRALNSLLRRPEPSPAAEPGR